ncbi:hypothetical protein D7D52_24170 [Nocardia yunnanensis]|uniref:Uncharacterized protein n=1 Tax=Nocardia yunnanensis TaxID=2382165 RepID=A0A386ZGT3_9NOCA|nr:hypothetical protein [Nocardia yunnanensis]AYF76403.1 hypothetical protein D7D52_24170 [Nocardia yunnanensis]
MNVLDAFNDDSGRTGRALTWITHRSGYALAAYAVACVVGWFFDSWWLTVPVLVVCVVFSGAVTVAMLHVQFTRLCPTCMTEVPADAPARAQRRRWQLRFEHLARRRAAVPVFLLLFLVPLLAVPYLPSWCSGITSAPGEAWAIGLAVSLWTHHRLRPWCPWCRNWGDGGAIHEPSPDPTNLNTVTS